MIRTSSAVRRSRTAAGVLLAAAALTACSGGTAHQGAAAVVGGRRIPISEVEARVTELRTAMAAQPGAPGAEPAGLTRQMVTDLVLDQVVSQALTDRRLSVSDGEIAKARDADSKLLGGEDALSREMLKQDVSAGEIDASYRLTLGIQKIAMAQGKDARTADGDAVVRAALTTAGTELKIQVNPRYGQWDPAKISLTDAVAAWLPQPTAAA